MKELKVRYLHAVQKFMYQQFDERQCEVHNKCSSTHESLHAIGIKHLRHDESFIMKKCCFCFGVL